MNMIETKFNQAKVFENPSNLVSAMVVPTGKVSVSDNVATVEVWQDNKIVDLKVNTLGTYPEVVVDGKLSASYEMELCAAVESEEKGVYYLKSLGFAEDENGAYTGINKTNPELLDETETTPENLFFIKSDVEPLSPFRRVDRYYQGAQNKLYVETKSYFLGDLSFGTYDFDITNWAGTRIKLDAGKTAFAQDFSKVLVKYNFADGKTEWVLFDCAALPLMGDVDFKKLSYIVSNNPTNGPQDESCMAGEDLVFLVGEVDLPEGTEIALELGKEAVANVDAALYETLRFRVKVLGEESTDNAMFSYVRTDGATGELPLKLAAGGEDTEGYLVFELKLREVQVWQNTVEKFTIALPEGNYELDYVKLFPTGNSSDVKLGEPLPMFSDGNIEKGFFIGSMERGIPTFDDYFATKPDGDKAREEYEAAVKNDETKPDKMYSDWRMVPLYAYDYIGAYPYMKEAGFTYDSDPAERLASLKEADPEAYEKFYLDYLFEDNGEPDAEGFYRTADKAGAKEIVYKPNQKYTTTDGVERTGTVLDIYFP